MEMKRTLTAALLFCAISLTGGLVMAGTCPKAGSATPPCTAMDTDGNGTIDAQEFAVFHENISNAPAFAEIDSDGDGQITRAEMMAMHQARFAVMGPGCRANGGCVQAGINCPKTQAMDEETREKYDAFLEDTAELRKEIAAKRAEKRALMRTRTPDPDQAAQLTRELLELRAQLLIRADEAGVEFGPGTGCMNHGGMMGQGRGCGKRGGMKKGPGMMNAPTGCPKAAAKAGCNGCRS